MRSWFLLSLAWLVAMVQAGGYQGCVERVMAYFAYEIDALNPEPQRTVGVKCKKWDYEKNNCINNDWVPCKPPPARCTFDQFVHNMGGSPTPKDWSRFQPGTNNLDIQETAKNCYNKFLKKNKKPPPNFKNFNVLKGANENFNDYIQKLNAVVDSARTLPTAGANKHLFERWNDATVQVLRARAGDHGSKVASLVEAKLHQVNIQADIRSLGSNPATGDSWVTVSWEGTVAKAQKNAPAGSSQNIQEDVSKVREDIYSDDAAKDHRSVIRSYKKVLDQNWECS